MLNLWGPDTIQNLILLAISIALHSGRIIINEVNPRCVKIVIVLSMMILGKRKQMQSYLLLLKW